MEEIGLFYGSDTGVTDDVTKDFVNFWGDDNINVMLIGSASVEDFKNYDKLILGLPTWYDGILQSDWEDFFDEFSTIDFTNKTVAIYGLGDQIGYGEYFVDGIGILAKVIIENGGKVIGNWPNKGYRHTDSVAIMEENTELFYGLAIDHDNESQLTDERLKTWIEQIKKEF
ncbi:flavodoxin [Cellulophaga baltica]|uniref:flavodoxin n=1 Tax=Cellulophaga TaxID=104264 RepID=UPI001C06629B|nr:MULTISPECIES: flavodoxin [Cellulophaga]MBU2996345.1 flavodoxin [Cellulophaga baltica]MDO6767741.1 flavodoxin [Cellulophaga sp. 1_MG-2023]